MGHDHVIRRGHRARPLPIGWMVLVIGAILYVAGSNIGSGWVVVLTAAMVGALALDLVAVWRTHRRTAVTLHLPVAATTTDPPVMRIAVTRPDLGTTLQLSDADGVGRTVVRTGTGTVRLVLPLARGRHDHVVAVARTVGPLGLAAAVGHHPSSDDGPLWCRPGTMPATGRVQALVGSDAVGRTLRRGEEDVRGVREFTSSDPRRAVHWRATARHGRLMVRESETSTGADLHLGIAGGTWTPGALDLACEVVASLGVAATTAGHDAHVLLDGAQRIWDDATWHDLALLPPAAGIPARPLAAAEGPSTLWLHQAGATGGIVVGGRELADREEVAGWLRGDA